ncbi:hypothetical protein DFH06DRAFT_1138392 [Mycena polygramma]|nr:hypothetical protein DFH06DRAFT_1138392 [Mycena polygramma]
MAKVNRNCTYAHARPTRLRPMRPHLLADRDAVDQWVAAEDLMADPDVPMHAPLADDEGMYGPVYRLSLAVYNPHAGKTEDLRLGRYQGIPTDKDAPLWTRRLPLFKYIRFTQPRAFVAMLVAGMSDIQFFEPASSKALLWARQAAVRLSARAYIMHSNMLARSALLSRDSSPVTAETWPSDPSKSGRGAKT